MRSKDQRPLPRVVASSSDLDTPGVVSNVPGNYFDKHGSRNPGVRLLMQRFHSALFDEINAYEPDSILDVGCGEGRTTRFVADQFSVAIHGAELEGHLLTEARILVPEARFVCASVYALPYPDRAFDVVVATEVLEHLHDPSGAVRELLRVARKAVILTVPHEPWWRLANMMRGKYLSDFGNTPGHVQHWTRTGFVRLLALQGNAPRVRGVGLWTFATVARA